MFDLNGSVALVTGAADGIGAATARELAQRGCNLALVDRDVNRLAMTVTALRTHPVQVSLHHLDIADAAAIAALPAEVIARHGRVNIIINNAGVALMGDVEQLSLDDFEWLFNINFWGVVRTCKAFLPALRNEPQAHIVNLSSVFGLVAPAGQAAYCASKYAVRGFSDALRHELEGTGITVSAVHPGGIRTRIAHHARRASAFDENQAQELADRFFSQVRTSPDEAARSIVSGIERRDPRILIGPDARVLDWMSRLMPVGYWRLIRRLFVSRYQTAASGSNALKEENP